MSGLLRRRNRSAGSEILWRKDAHSSSASAPRKRRRRFPEEDWCFHRYQTTCSRDSERSPYFAAKWCSQLVRDNCWRPPDRYPRRKTAMKHPELPPDRLLRDKNSESSAFEDPAQV